MNWSIIRKIFSRTLLPLLVLLPVLTACVEELQPGKGSSAQEEGEVWVNLDFGADLMPVVSTRASAETENQLFNFFLFIFDMNNGGTKVYGRMFDSDNRSPSATDFNSSANEAWYVEYTHTAADGVTYPGGGKVKVKAPLGTNYNIYMIGNLDADMIRISSDLLSHTISSEADLREFEIQMNQEVVSRNGYFPMSGSIRGVEVEKGADNKGHFKLNDKDAILSMLRFDAKIEFNFEFNKENINSFEAKLWQVLNVPKTAFVLSYDERGISGAETTGEDSGDVPVPSDADDLGAYYSRYADKYFDTDLVNFEDVDKNGVSSFVFYMLPNRLTPKKSHSDWVVQDSKLGKWAERDRQYKLSTGKNQMADLSYTSSDGNAVTKRMRIFENANDFSTYVVVTGRVDMVLKHGEQAGQVLGADVQYLIHLGDWSGGKYDNFNVKRNTHYKYKVTINDVNSIRVEVETSRDGQEFKESQPGATGEVVIAKEEIAVCDAHYTTKTMTFHLSNFYNNGENIADNLIWTVDTPFIDDDIVQDGGVPNIPDYEWVHFRINKGVGSKEDKTFRYSDRMRFYTDLKFAESADFRDSTTLNKEKYNDRNGNVQPGVAGYHNDGIMDIITLVDYIKKQVALYEQYDKDKGVNTSDFDYSVDADGKLDPVIKMTAFVDEYYYEKAPVTNEKDPLLWKKFVNAKDRSMNILCDSNISKDGESRVTGSVITIQQHSIQTIYNNEAEGLQTAWGLELTDEFSGKLVWNKNDGASKGNTSRDNGLQNSVQLWGLYSAKSDDYFLAGQRWDEYVNFQVANSDVPLLISSGTADAKDIRYSCFTRNRDNNGDGKIDRNEIRWYMASVQQLMGLYLGDPVLNLNVRLYNRSAAQRKSDDPKVWKQHILTSTHNAGGNGPIMIWAEEGLSSSDALVGWSSATEAGDYHSIRCVRSLGYIGGLDSSDPEGYSLDKTPQNFITFDAATSTIDAGFLNSASLRYYTSRELESHDENAIENRLYRKFEVAEPMAATSGGNWSTVNGNISKSVLEGTGNPYCPNGYRLPNQRELAVLLYFSTIDVKNQLCRTYWSFGDLGDDKDTKKSNTGFSVTDSNTMTVDAAISATAGNIRCVRDVR